MRIRVSGNGKFRDVELPVEDAVLAWEMGQLGNDNGNLYCTLEMTWGDWNPLQRLTGQNITQNIKYNFEWNTPSKDCSYLYHYPKNIKEDWLALLKECEQMLIEDGIIHGDNQVEGLEELQEKQSGGMQMI